jgi:ABC-2 type transport system permease protein
VTWAIQTASLTKRFPAQTGWRSLLYRGRSGLPAVNCVDLHVRSGELFGLLGPNGAGKTTLIKLLCTLIRPTSGSAQVNGYDLSQDTEIKASVGLVTSDERSFYWRLTGRQNLEFFANLQHIPQKEISGRIEEVLLQMGVDQMADRRFLTYSTGVRQRFSIARALLHRPRLLFLDEPTKGLDPEATDRLHALIRDHLVDRQGITVFLTTHDLHEAESLCDRIAILSHGQIYACGTLAELRQDLGGQPDADLRDIYARFSNQPGSPTSYSHDPPADQVTRAEKSINRVGYGFSLRIAAAFLKRDFINEIAYPVSFLLQIIGIFFSVGVFYFIAQLVGPAATPLLTQYGGDYFSFVLIGIAFTSYFGVGLSSFSSNLREAQTTGTLEAMLTTPTRLSAIIWASALWDYLLTTIKVFVYLGFGALFLNVDLARGNYLSAILVLALTMITFSSIGIIASSFIMVLKRGDPIAWFFNALSGLLGGVYYPLEVLPGWMQWIAHWIPITYALEAMRMALLRGASFQSLLPDMLGLTAFALALFPLSLFCFRFAVNRAKIEGSLTHY